MWLEALNKIVCTKLSTTHNSDNYFHYYFCLRPKIPKLLIIYSAIVPNPTIYITKLTHKNKAEVSMLALNQVFKP